MRETDSILVGTYGWDYGAWAGKFYPQQLPSDWRFCYYSNELRSLLVPADAWENLEHRDTEQWVEDSDENFRFILELPENMQAPASLPVFEKRLLEFIRLVEPIRHQTMGLLLRLPSVNEPNLEIWESKLKAVNHYKPICVDPPVEWRSPEFDALLERTDTGVCWHADRDTAPRAGGRLLVAFTKKTEPKALRHILGAIDKWRDGGRVAGLFVEPSPNAAKQAQKLRTLAELMDV